ncbi:hypothetical protein E4A49_11750 [Micrococcus lylae]|uniref:Uncharacterized protein n=1 Tax=Micrococcus lylae TaxID=1273 RepID=A0ABY2K0M5_9MICC|nr:hypothetical protein E4A49_11750 [Micrococcus lylae]
MRHKRSPRRYAEAFARRFFEALGAMAVIAGALAVFAPDLLKDRVIGRKVCMARACQGLCLPPQPCWIPLPSSQLNPVS